MATLEIELIARLEALVKSKDRELENRALSINSLKTKCASLETANQNYVEELEEMRAENASLKKEVKRLKVSAAKDFAHRAQQQRAVEEVEELRKANAALVKDVLRLSNPPLRFQRQSNVGLGDTPKGDRRKPFLDSPTRRAKGELQPSLPSTEEGDGDGDGGSSSKRAKGGVFLTEAPEELQQSPTGFSLPPLSPSPSSLGKYIILSSSTTKRLQERQLTKYLLQKRRSPAAETLLSSPAKNETEPQQSRGFPEEEQRRVTDRGTIPPDQKDILLRELREAAEKMKGEIAYLNSVKMQLDYESSRLREERDQLRKEYYAKERKVRELVDESNQLATALRRIERAAAKGGVRGAEDDAEDKKKREDRKRAASIFQNSASLERGIPSSSLNSWREFQGLVKHALSELGDAASKAMRGV